MAVAVYGEPISDNQTQTQDVDVKQMFNDLLKSLIDYGVTRIKYEQAIKMAKPACEKDPKNCPYYIRQALIALGLNPDQIMGQGYGTQTVGVPKYQTGNSTYIPQQANATSNSTYPVYPNNYKHDDNTKWILLTIGAVVLTGITVWYISNRG